MLTEHEEKNFLICSPSRTWSGPFAECIITRQVFWTSVICYWSFGCVVGSSTPAENLLLRPPSISYWGGQVATGACLEADAVCGGHSIYVPIILAFPYFSRFLQCLRQYRDTKDEMFLHNGVCSDKTTLLFFFLDWPFTSCITQVSAVSCGRLTSICNVASS